MVELVYPFAESAVRALRAGDAVSVNGLVRTGRDRFHKHFADGGKLPCDFRDGALFHCGPVVVKNPDGSWRVVAGGPTTSVRESPYEPAFIEQTGVRLIIGKGGILGSAHGIHKDLALCLYAGISIQGDEISRKISKSKFSVPKFQIVISIGEAYGTT